MHSDYQLPCRSLRVHANPLLVICSQIVLILFCTVFFYSLFSITFSISQFFFLQLPHSLCAIFFAPMGLWWPRIRNTAMRKGIRCIRNEKQNYMSTMEMKNIPMAHTNTTEKRTSSITLPQSIFIKVVLA